MSMLLLRWCVVFPSVAAHGFAAPAPVQSAPPAGSTTAPVGGEVSDWRERLEHFSADREVLARRYDAEFSAQRRQRMEQFLRDWQSRVETKEAAPRTLEGALDRVLLAGEVEYLLRVLEREQRRAEETEPWLPFRADVSALHDARRAREEVEGKAAAASLERIRRQAVDARKHLRAVWKGAEGEAPADAGEPEVPPPQEALEIALDPPSPRLGLLAHQETEDMLRALGDWFELRDGYDPLFSWWCRAPYRQAREALEAYSKLLREEVAGFKPASDQDRGEGEPAEPIVGDPIGREALLEDLRHERIAYNPEELIEIAKRERDWCHARLREAAAEMGLRDDWKAALEQVKARFVEPGQQPQLIKDLSEESIRFLEQRELLTIPPLADEVWRLEMMSPKLQQVNPFFTGGEVISVSFPTDGMEHEDKLMSLRGNNRHFSRAVVHHELIPGHHLQGFMTRRYMPHRRAFGTPFWTEGWALYWELRLWDLGFAVTPEDRIGMLFWRLHRCARIIFSLSFHSGQMTAQECVDFLVEEVGHERMNAEGEVRRSFNGSYEPLYQAAYLLGGMQLIALHAELVKTGQLTEREFHDRILQGGAIPIDLVRARLLGQAPRLGEPSSWRFAKP